MSKQRGVFFTGYIDIPTAQDALADVKARAKVAKRLAEDIEEEVLRFFGSPEGAKLIVSLGETEPS